MPSITFYFFAAAIMLIIVILSVPSEGRTVYPASGHTEHQHSILFSQPTR